MKTQKVKTPKRGGSLYSAGPKQKKAVANISDNRSETITQRKLSEMARQSPDHSESAQLKQILNSKATPVQKVKEEDEEVLQGKFATAQRQKTEEEEILQGKFSIIQRKENKTGLPDNLKSGIENLSGISMNDVNVHRNSDEPAEVQAHAFAQGPNIHLAPGQEKHLPHEAWHVVQQKQGRVKPTLQMKGNVNVNDDPSLEREAEVMGAKALQMKALPDSALENRTSVGTIQRVDDEGKRSETDLRMNELKEEVIKILTTMRTLGEDWELKYGEQGREKASSKAEDLLAGKKTDYGAEIRRAALKELWSQLTLEQKIEMIGEAARLGLKGVKEVGENSLSMPGLPDVGGSKPKEKENVKEREPRSGRREKSESDESSLSVRWISKLDSEDLKTLYNINKTRRRVLDEIAETKSAIVKGAGDVGERVGSEIGKLRNEVDFNKRMKAQQQAFMVARKRYEMLEAAIKENDDVSRYQNELDALQFAVMNPINGPAMVYGLLGGSEETRKRHPDICQDAIEEVKWSKPFLGRGGIKEAAGSLASKAGRLFTGLVSGENPDQQKIDEAKTVLAGEISRVAGKSWGSFTSWVFTPSGVSKIKKELPRDKTPDEQLNWAKQAASEAASKESKNRSPETQIFYDAIAYVKTDDLADIQKSISIIREIGNKLG